jgi:subtilisin family serine protease
MSKNIIHKENIKPYNPVVWQGRPVWKYCAQLKNHLTLTIGAEYAKLFAEPLISESAETGNTDTIWLAENITKSASKITALNSGVREKFESTLAAKIRRIEQHANDLLAGNDSKEREWGGLILKCLEIPDYNYVLTEGEDLVLVMWGFKLRSQIESFSLTKKIATLPLTNLPVVEDDKIEPEIIQEENTIEPKVEVVVKPIEEPLNEDKHVQNLNEHKEPTIEENELKDQKVDETGTQNTNAETNKQDNEQDIDDKKIIYVRPGLNWKKLLWILLLVLLFLLLMLLLFKNCSGFNSILPEKPNVIIPVDSTKIKSDEDSTTKVVSDRLNAAIGAKDKTVEDFAKAFKKIYKSSNYKIIYFDDKTKRVQLQVPESERVKLIKELKEKLPEFKLLVWEESLFKNGSKPSDPGFGNPRQSWHHEKIKVYSAWDQSMGNKDLVIAVIDDGFDLSHPELNKSIVKSRNLCDPKSKVTIGKSGHGTHVAALALGLADNGMGLSGIAPNCKLMPLQVADKNGIMTSTAIIDAVLYAINNGADVINMSLGKMMDPRIAKLPESKQEEMVATLFLDEQEFWNQLFGIAAERGITVVLAGGNQNVIIGLDPMQRTVHTINVSATDPANNKASFSNYGRRSSLSAPGVQIYSAIPGGKMGPMDGTSMAAPIVTGAVALMKSVNPSFTNKEILDLLQNTGIPIASSAYVGNLIQLDAALNISEKRRERTPKVECPDAQSRIDKLLREIEIIREECSYDGKTDTLKLPVKSGDLSFAKGRWKSTTDLFNTESGEKITVYFDFNASGKGKITLIEENSIECPASLNFDYSSGIFNINQLEPARCASTGYTYNPYRFECRANSEGNAVCYAKNKVNKLNKFEFNLVAVK